MKKKASLRIIFFHIILLLPVVAISQTILPGHVDTVSIKEIVIRPSLEDKGIQIYKHNTIDSIILMNEGLMTIAEILSWHSPVFIKNYGPGGTATPSFRGTGAGNTYVTWNGLKVDHPMVGQADLSLLPAGIVDELHIYYGGASMEHRSGATGGSIEIENKPSWGKSTKLSISTNAGSFNSYSGQALMRTGSETFQSVTRVYVSSSLNNYSYVNRIYSAEPFRAIRNHNSGEQKGFMQELYYKKSENVLSIRFWYQEALRNIPASLLVYPENNGGKQSDEHARFMVNYEFKKNLNKYYLTGAIMHARLDYMNQVSSIDSRNLSDVAVIKAGADIRAGSHYVLNLLLDEELCAVNSNNYEAFSKRNVVSLSANLITRNTGNLGVNFLLRQILYNDTFLIPDFSGGVFLVNGKNDYILKGNFSRSSRIPSMNDLYWFPGGNPGLKNEYSYISELSFEINEYAGEFINIKGDVALFDNEIYNMIRWRPGSASIWTAENIGMARSYGFESSIKTGIEVSKLTASVIAGYSYTRAFNKEDRAKAQLIYIPLNQANVSLNMQYGRLFSSWRSLAAGTRFTEADNSNYLPAYFINSLTAGFRLSPAWGNLELAFDVENIFNHEYQTMAYYPLPGRAYRIRFTTQIINKRK